MAKKDRRISPEREREKRLERRSTGIPKRELKAYLCYTGLYRDMALHEFEWIELRWHPEYGQFYGFRPTRNASHPPVLAWIEHVDGHTARQFFRPFRKLEDGSVVPIPFPEEVSEPPSDDIEAPHPEEN